MTIAAGNPKKGMRFQWERCIREADLPWSVKAIGLLLATYGDANGRDIFPGIDRIEQDSGLKRRAVLNALKALRETGWAVKEPYRRRRANDTYHLVIPGAECVHESAPSDDEWVHGDAPSGGGPDNTNECTWTTRMSAPTGGNFAGQDVTYHGVTTEYKELSPAGGANDADASSHSDTAPPTLGADASASALAGAGAQAHSTPLHRPGDRGEPGGGRPQHPATPEPPSEAEALAPDVRGTGNAEFERYAELIERLDIEALADVLDDFELERRRMLNWARGRTRVEIGLSRREADSLDGEDGERYLRRVYWWALRGFTNKVEGWPQTLTAPLEALVRREERAMQERTVYYQASGGSTESLLNQMYRAVDELDGLVRAQYAARFRERRPRTFAECLEDAEVQLHREWTDGSRREPDAIEVEALTLKYALLHYSANDRWPHWIVPPSMLPDVDDEAA